MPSAADPANGPASGPARLAAARTNFFSVFGSEGPAPRCFRAPGRVNLIGEHTDYNLGFVLPAAISLATRVLARPRRDRRLRLASAQAGGPRDRATAEHLAPAILTADLDALAPRRDWSDYVLGVAAALERAGARLRGADLWIETDLPLGAGLSSSAALEVSAGLALLALARDAAGRAAATGDAASAGDEADAAAIGALRATPPSPSPLEAWPGDADRLLLARAGQTAEHEFVGAQVGIMDQSISAFGRAGQAMLLDCRDLGRDFVPLPSAFALAVCNTGVRHEIAASAYNQRRSECREAVAAFAALRPGVASLRDVTLEDLAAFGPQIPAAPLRRARHIVTENARVLATARALRAGDAPALGPIFAASHRSMRDDYEISCPELDAMVEIAARAPGFLAGRMTGGGFGGCTVNFVAADQAAAFAAAVARGYRAETGRAAEISLVAAADGAGEI